MKYNQKDNRSPLKRSIRLKIILAVSICGLVLMIFSLWLLNDSMNYVDRDLTGDKLAADLRFLRDYLGDDEDTVWNMRDGALYLGDTLIGDGTKETAYLEPLEHCEELSGTSYYIFVRTYNDSELAYVESGSYWQGHYLRICGTTKGRFGENIIGTYIDRDIAEAIESAPGGVYVSDANVNGRKIYSRYELIYDASGSPIGIISDGKDTSEMASLIRSQKTRGVILIIAVMIFMSVGLGIIVSTMLNTINKIKDRLKTIGTGVLPEDPLVITTQDEMADIAESINDMVDSLREKERIGAELDLATDIQAHMLPSIFPPFPEHDEFDVYAIMDPAKEVGGDFYDFFMLDDKNLAVVIADVSGKGVPAALFMVIAKTLIKNYTQSGLAPCDAFTKVNQLLCEGNETGLFVTAWMGILNIDTGLLTYVNAGHNPPLIKLGDGGFSYLRSRPGFVLAGMEGLRYKQFELQMNPGDKLFLYTDGVTEAMNGIKELYGEKRLLANLNMHANDSLSGILHSLRQNIDVFVGEQDQFDDITMLVMDFRKLANDGMVEKEFEADEKVLCEVISFLESELKKFDCPSKAMMQISIAIEESFVNIARYAYGEGTGKVKLGLRREEDGVTLRFSDHGMPFDPVSGSTNELLPFSTDDDVGGLGIFMVKKTVDEVNYKYENGQNILTLKKNY